MTEPCNPVTPEQAEEGGATAAGWNRGRRNVTEDNDTLEEGTQEEVSAFQPDPEPERSVEELEEQAGLELDFSAGRSVWLADRDNLLGSSEDAFVPVLPLRQDPGVSNSYPADVPTTFGQQLFETGIGPDTFRYVTGKQWMNLSHGSGPPGGLGLFLFQRRSDRSGRGIFSFHNPTQQLFGGPDVRMRKFINGDIFNARIRRDPTTWRNYNSAIDLFSQDNDLGLPIYYNSFRIEFNDATRNPNVNLRLTRRSKWNWRDYMYGLPSITTDSNLASQYRRDGLPEEELSTWANWNEANYSKNLFPVMPFFGQNETFPVPLPENAYLNENLRPPSVGEAVFFDHVTNVPTFLTKDEIELLDIPGSKFLDVNGVYNFYDCVYEDIISQVYSENRLPNFYRLRPENYSTREANNQEEVRRRNVLRRDRLLSGQQDAFDELVRREAAQRYGVFTMEDYPSVDPWLVFANPSTEDFKRVYKERRLFPMYAEIEFATSKPSLVAEAFSLGSNSSFMDNILLPFARKEDNDVIAVLSSRGDGNVALVGQNRFETVSQYLATGRSPSELLGQSEATSLSDITEERLKIMDLNVWYRWFQSQESNNAEEEMSPQERFRSIITNMMVRSRIKEVIEQNYREDFEEVLRGKSAFSEAVAYRVEKRYVSDGNVLKQNFYFGTSEEAENIKYVDSQVEYGKDYTYTIYQLVLVIGTQYCYLDNMTEKSVRELYQNSLRGDPSLMFFGVMHKPSVKIIEVPAREETITILDRPPLAPDVNVIPFRGSSSRVLFNLNSGTGELFAPPILLESDDEAQFENIAKNQKARFSPNSIPESDAPVDPEDLIQFRNDDETNIFEVFRVDSEPKNWRDFFDKKIGRIESTATNASFQDTIQPNKKYYYTFRSEDIHGHVSNPSHIYQVELVRDGEMTFLKMEIFKFKKEVNVSTTSFRNRIEITPAFLQRIIDLPSNGRFSDWEEEKRVGNSSSPVWGKKFKFRITSKSTGKQIDLNFNFVQKYGRISEEIQNTVVNTDIC